ncbi:hypothetical protein Ccar_23900 [Clostridium carboxidivorans P7]|uniref:Vitamin B12 dependent methionine synthase activation region n=1 Tax=Clostridium carboxidivorans P7 TaxID=536227 RepID=C6PYT9_9CLOT|nr:hypothetical protein [Clostridium carboxidivorans]AKN33701.1 hypothetical protein Ccar_23900 [Clostridium carboxidivorans P7]EET85570.1 conserved hypothetical protein [Clostridium carboxidivorans P7]EFG86700.1 hypothetical protein CLCAR_3651 [Clostridium carboxidivorans P7]
MKTLTNGCILLDDLKFNIEYSKLYNELNVSSKEQSIVLKELIAEAEKIAKPKALLKKCTIDKKSHNSTIIGGEEFFSRVISVNLRNELIAFPYIITSGIELQKWCESKEDKLISKVAEHISQSILIQVHLELQKYIESKFNTGSLARVNPGSTIDWNMDELRKIFKILEDPMKYIVVSLNDKFYMAPSKTYSGIYFHNENNYKNCFMCPGLQCPLREVPYDKNYYTENYENFKTI